MTHPTPYPRDLRGYGAHPPQAQWPGNAASPCSSS